MTEPPDNPATPGPSPSTPPVSGRIDRDPTPPPRHVIEQVNGRLLDPGTALTIAGIVPRPTVYVGPHLVVSASRSLDSTIELLNEAADPLGWSVREDPDGPRARVVDRDNPDQTLGVSRLLIELKDPDDGGVTAATAPDGWVLLQQARARASRRRAQADAQADSADGQEGESIEVPDMSGIGLDHVMFVHSPQKVHWESNPVHWESNPVSAPLGSYAQMGSGGRQPVAYVGPRPIRRLDIDFFQPKTRFYRANTEGGGPESEESSKPRRPIVAVLDTGCGEHPWLDGWVRTDVALDNDGDLQEIGDTDPETNPEIGGDHDGPLDGVIDPLSGHGTFIAGVIHQACPDADIVAWRVVNSTGPIVESDFIDTLTKVVDLVQRHADGDESGMPIDVLNLSMGYYHETPGADTEDPTLSRLLGQLGRCGTVVVCSAGNDATARPLYPAAYAPWREGVNSATNAGRVPIVSVGALNPNGTTALFSNTGPWVREYQLGASVVSTIPQFQGGLQPSARTYADGRLRESLDPDDFSSGFSLWSGTSFAAPLLAGKLAGAMLDATLQVPTEADLDAALKRGWDAVEAVTQIRRPADQASK